MNAAEILDARARAELEMFYRITVEEGAAYLAWCAATEFPLSSRRSRALSVQAPQQERA